MTRAADAPAHLQGEHGAVPLGPDSLTWRLGLSRTAVLLAGRALLMQTAHPVIGAGVRDFSSYRSDPWGRLDRTLVSLQTQMFGGDQLVVEALRLRELHKPIKGTGFAGERYSAFDPSAYAFVHLSNFDTLLMYHTLLCGPRSDASRHRLYQEWRQIGRVLGVRDRDMPGDLNGLHDYINDVSSETLAANPTAIELLDVVTNMRDVPPPGMLPAPIWAAIKPLGRSVVYAFAVGTLPPPLRAKLDPSWSERDNRRLLRAAAAVRMASPLVPTQIMQYPMGLQARRAVRASGRDE